MTLPPLHRTVFAHCRAALTNPAGQAEHMILVAFSGAGLHEPPLHSGGQVQPGTVLALGLPGLQKPLFVVPVVGVAVVVARVAAVVVAGGGVVAAPVVVAGGGGGGGAAAVVEAAVLVLVLVLKEWPTSMHILHLAGHAR